MVAALLWPSHELRVPDPQGARPTTSSQPWGRDKYREATVVSVHETLSDAYAELDRLADTLERRAVPEGDLKIYVVDEQRRPVPRPWGALETEVRKALPAFLKLRQARGGAAPDAVAPRP